MKNSFLPKNIEIPDDVLYQNIEGESVLLNLKTEQYFGLDEVGTRFWHLISENGNTDSALSTMLREFDVSEETLRSDLAGLTYELLGQGLLSTTE